MRYYYKDSLNNTYSFKSEATDSEVELISITEEEFNELTNYPVNPIKEEINELKSLLSSTDYKAIKYAEGELSEEEYEPIKLQRRAWRARINELEALREVIVEQVVEN